MITFIESGNRIATENFEIGEIYTITYTNETIRTMCCIGIGSDFVMFQGKTPNTLFCLTIGTSETVLTIDLGGGGGGSMNYNELENKPQINGIVLIGNKTSSDLGLLSQADLDNYVTDTELTTELADYATNASVVSALASKQDTLTTPQLTAVNSGITSSLVTQIGTNTNAIAGKQDTLTTPQLTAINSGITNSLVNQITTNKNNILSNTLNGGGINKLQVTATTTTVNGIIFTVNADKTITATGSITDNTQNAIFTLGAYTAVSGDVLSEGFVKANSKAYVYARGGSTNLASEPYIAILAGDIGVQREYACVIRYDTVGQVNITFKPMICNSDNYAKSGVYQPYALSNVELTAAIQALQTQLANQ